MSLKNPWLLFGTLTITIPGTVGEGLQVSRPLVGEVTYTSKRLCALKGASVDLTCSYTPLRNQTVSSVFWFSPKQRHSWWSKEDPEDLLLDSEYMGRVKYSGAKGRSSTLTLSDLRLTDSGVYHCLLMSGQQRYSDLHGVNMTVTGLQIKVVRTKSLDLSCTTLCSMEFKMLKLPLQVRYLFFIIYKDGQFQNYTSPNAPTVRLGRTDGGSYSCAVGGLDHLRSPSVCVLRDRCWGVSYSEERICALRGSSVQISSSYTHPRSHTRIFHFWFKKGKQDNKAKELHDRSKFKGRVQYISDTHSYFNVTIQDVRESDTGEYHHVMNRTYAGIPGVILTVTDLHMKINADMVAEGQNMVLTCSTTCTLRNNPTYIWYRDGQPITSRHTIRNNRLYLISVNSEDGGNYSCTVKGHGHLTSSAVTLNIPKMSRSHTPMYATLSVIPLFGGLLVCGMYWRKRRNTSSSADSPHRDINIMDANTEFRDCTYTSLSASSRCPEYDTLAVVHVSSNDEIYENLRPQETT